MSKKILTGLLLSSSIMLQADMLGVEVGGSIWNASPSGTISKGTNSNVDIEKDLGLGTQNINLFLWFF